MELEPPQLPQSRQGELSDGWRTVAFITWILTAAGIIAVAITSRTVGRPIWWLWSESDPASPLFILLPVVAVAVPLYAAGRKPEILTRAGLISSSALVISSTFDIASSPGVAAGVAIVSTAALSVSIALWAVARQYR